MKTGRGPQDKGFRPNKIWLPSSFRLTKNSQLIAVISPWESTENYCLDRVVERGFAWIRDEMVFFPKEWAEGSWHAVLLVFVSFIDVFSIILDFKYSSLSLINVFAMFIWKLCNLTRIFPFKTQAEKSLGELNARVGTLNFASWHKLFVHIVHDFCMSMPSWHGSCTAIVRSLPSIF